MDEPRRRRPLAWPNPLALRGPLRSFALGGLGGAAGTIATVRRLRRTPLRPRAVTGLAAFEDAPCFREIVEREGHEYGDGVAEAGQEPE